MVLPTAYCCQRCKKVIVWTDCLPAICYMCYEQEREEKESKKQEEQVKPTVVVEEEKD